MLAIVLASASIGLALAGEPPPGPTAEAIRAGVTRALPLLEKGSAGYVAQRDCFSCHHQAVPVLAMTTAKGRGFAVPAEAAGDPVEHTEADLLGSIDAYRKGNGQGGGVTRAGYALLTLEVGGKAPDEVTDAVLDGRVHNPSTVVAILALCAHRAQGWRRLRPVDAPFVPDRHGPGADWPA